MEKNLIKEWIWQNVLLLVFSSSTETLLKARNYRHFQCYKIPWKFLGRHQYRQLIRTFLRLLLQLPFSRWTLLTLVLLQFDSHFLRGGQYETRESVIFLFIWSCQSPLFPLWNYAKSVLFCYVLFCYKSFCSVLLYCILFCSVLLLYPMLCSVLSFSLNVSSAPLSLFCSALLCSTLFYSFCLVMFWSNWVWFVLC